MPIVSSTHTLGGLEQDGRRWVSETHTDHLGGTHVAQYLAVAGADYVAIRTARAAQIEAALADSEAQQLIGE